MDYEPEKNYTLLHKQNYAKFLSAMATAMHAQGKLFGFNTASWGILNAWDVYKGTSADIFASMTPTYFGTNLEKSRKFVQDQIDAGIAVGKIGVGLGTMLAPGNTPQWNYNWTQANLASYVNWLTATPGVTRLELWRADINGYKTTAGWFLDIVTKFLAGTAVV